MWKAGAGVEHTWWRFLENLDALCFADSASARSDMQARCGGSAGAEGKSCGVRRGMREDHTGLKHERVREFDNRESEMCTSGSTSDLCAWSLEGEPRTADPVIYVFSECFDVIDIG